MANDAFIYDSIRTPRGKKKNGALNEITPADLVSKLMIHLQRKHNLDTSQVDDIIMGCVTPIGDQGANIGKIASQYAGWDTDVPEMQENRFCSSSLETFNLAGRILLLLAEWELQLL